MKISEQVHGSVENNTEFTWVNCDVKIVDMFRRRITFVEGSGRELLLTMDDETDFSWDGASCGMEDFLAGIGMKTTVIYEAATRVMKNISLASAKQEHRSLLSPKFLLSSVLSWSSNI